MRRAPSIVWGALVLGASWAFFEFAIAPLTGRLTGTAAPLPSSLVLIFVGLTLVAILLYVSITDERWRGFIGPVVSFLRRKSVARAVVLAIVPPALGVLAYVRAAAPPEPPGDPPAIHFGLPNKYVDVKNPLDWSEENIREGGVLYVRHCAMCHGDAQDGDGMFARAWQPKPANFRDPGTIAQLPENYLFWRIKEGGPGVPKGSIEHRSVMPPFDGVLSDDQIWKVIVFEYTNAGQKPAKRE